jgi:hypothetical protein
MLTHSQRGSLKPEQIARLLRHAIDPQATAKARAQAIRRLLAARERMSYDDLATAVKRLTATSAQAQDNLKRCVRELFSAS